VTAPALILTSLVTSGLRPNYDAPLEIGLLAVSRATFEPVDTIVLPMLADVGPLLDAMDPKVAEMHTAHGLLNELVEAGAKFDSFKAAARVVDPMLVDFVERSGAAGDCPSPLICFGTDWTHRWLLAHFPAFAARMKGELDMGLIARTFGRGRDTTDGRAENNLVSLLALTLGLRAGFA
jgi:hypothetical protein